MFSERAANVLQHSALILEIFGLWLVYIGISQPLISRDVEQWIDDHQTVKQILGAFRPRSHSIIVSNGGFKHQVTPKQSKRERILNIWLVLIVGLTPPFRCVVVCVGVVALFVAADLQITARSPSQSHASKA